MTAPKPLDLPRLSPILLALLEEGEDVAVVVGLSPVDGGYAGRRLLVTSTRVEGSLSDPEADAAAVALARRSLEGDPGLVPGTYSLPAAGEGSIEAFLELHHPPWELVIVGAGHVAQPLCTMGALLGLRVTVLDDRPQFATRERFPEADRIMAVDFSDPFAKVPLHRWSHVVLVTRGHKYDYECLRRVLREKRLPAYVGMIGSRRRVRATFDALLKEGVSRESLGEVHAPIGLDIGGETPAEIALSVAAELVHHWRGGTGRPLSEMEHVLERYHPAVPGPEKSPAHLAGPSPGSDAERPNRHQES